MPVSNVCPYGNVRGKSPCAKVRSRAHKLTCVLGRGRVCRHTSLCACVRLLVSAPCFGSLHRYRRGLLRVFAFASAVHACGRVYMHNNASFAFALAATSSLLDLNATANGAPKLLPNERLQCLQGCAALKAPKPLQLLALAIPKAADADWPERASKQRSPEQLVSLALSHVAPPRLRADGDAVRQHAAVPVAYLRVHSPLEVVHCAAARRRDEAEHPAPTRQSARHLGFEPSRQSRHRHRRDTAVVSRAPVRNARRLSIAVADATTAADDATGTDNTTMAAITAGTAAATSTAAVAVATPTASAITILTMMNAFLWRGERDVRNVKPRAAAAHARSVSKRVRLDQRDALRLRPHCKHAIKPLGALALCAVFVLHARLDARRVHRYKPARAQPAIELVVLVAPSPEPVGAAVDVLVERGAQEQHAARVTHGVQYARPLRRKRIVLGRHLVAVGCVGARNARESVDVVDGDVCRTQARRPAALRHQLEEADV
eukprot:6204967-Pleurochrysis_carterae.AAC.4